MRSLDPLLSRYAPAAAAAVSGKLTLVEHKLITSAVQTVTFSGLAGDTDKLYMLIISMKAGAAIPVMTVRPNGVSTNQYGQTANWNGAAASAGAITELRLASAPANAGEVFGLMLIGSVKVRNAVARIRHFLSWSGDELTDGTVANYQHSYSVWNETATEITSLDVRASVASGIGDGSTLTLYKFAES